MMEENFGIYLCVTSIGLLLGLLIALVAGIPKLLRLRGGK
jgi:hypothetical protein